MVVKDAYTYTCTCKPLALLPRAPCGAPQWLFVFSAPRGAAVGRGGEGRPQPLASRRTRCCLLVDPQWIVTRRWIWESVSATRAAAAYSLRGREAPLELQVPHRSTYSVQRTFKTLNFGDAELHVRGKLSTSCVSSKACTARPGGSGRDTHGKQTQRRAPPANPHDETS